MGIIVHNKNTGTLTGRGKVNVAFIALDSENLASEHFNDKFHLELGDYKIPHFKPNTKIQEERDSDSDEEDEDRRPSFLDPQTLSSLIGHMPKSMLVYLTS